LSDPMLDDTFLESEEETKSDEPAFETAFGNEAEFIFKSSIINIIQFMVFVSIYLYMFKVVDVLVISMVNTFTVIGLWAIYVKKKMGIITLGSKYNFIYIIQRTGGRPLEYIFFIKEYEEVVPTTRLAKMVWDELDPSLKDIIDTVFGKEGLDQEEMKEAERYRTFLFTTLEGWQFIMVAPAPVEDILYFFPSEVPYRGWVYPSKCAYAEVIELTRIPSPDHEGVMIPIFFLILGDKFPIIRPPEKELVIAEIVSRLNLYRAVQLQIALKFAEQNVIAIKQASRKMLINLKKDIENMITPYMRLTAIKNLARDVQKFEREEEKKVEIDWGILKYAILFLAGLLVGGVIIALLRP